MNKMVRLRDNNDHFNTVDEWLVLAVLVLTLTAFGGALLRDSSHAFVESVVVDGKLKGPSAMDNQSKEAEMIDPFNVRTCGLSDPDTYEMGFVNNAKHGQFPWMVSLQITDIKGNGVHFCCGAFISDRWILSAAHCFADDMFKRNYFADGIFRIVAGTPEAYSRTNERFKAKYIYYHARFQPKRPIGFDIALIELESPATLTHVRPQEPNDGSTKPPGEHIPYINAICLPLSGKEYEADQKVRVVGWGASEYNNTQSASNVLLHTDLNLTNTTECVNLYSRNKRLKTVKTHYQKYDDLLCASFADKRDACQGDSGSSLIEYADNKAVSVGIVSYGLGCANPVAPGVYTKTSAYLPWIRDITIKKKESKMEYILLTPRTPGDGQFPDEDEMQEE